VGLVGGVRENAMVELVNRLLGGLEMPFRAFWQKVRVKMIVGGGMI